MQVTYTYLLDELQAKKLVAVTRALSMGYFREDHFQGAGHSFDHHDS